MKKMLTNAAIVTPFTMFTANKAPITLPSCHQARGASGAEARLVLGLAFMGRDSDLGTK